MRTKELPLLPMRLNTYERVKKDTELRRIKDGKYKKLYTFIPTGKKMTGSAIETIYEKEHTNPKHFYLPRKKWLGKTGEATYGIFSKNFSLPQTIKTERDMNIASLLEYITDNVYRVLGDGYFETTKVRLSYLPLMNKFLKDNEIVQAYKEDYNIKKSLKIMSKWVPGYHDLGELEVKDKENIISFMNFIKKYKRPPELVIEPETKQEIELKGIMGVLAAATSLADIDVLGNENKNTGFIIERDRDNKIVSARVIKIVPGYAFSYDKINYEKLKNLKNIVVEKTHSIIIEWEQLTEKQREEFLEVKRHNLEIIKDERIVKYLLFKENKFNQSDIEKIMEKIVTELENKFINHVKAQGSIYEKDLKEYEPKREKIFKKAGDEEFKKGDYDRALWNYEKDLEIMIKKYGEKDVKVGKSYNSITKTENKRGNYLRAEKFCFKSLEIFEKTLLANDPNIGKIYGDLGIAYHGQGKYDKAIEYHNKNLVILLSFLNPPIPESYNNLISESLVILSLSSLNPLIPESYNNLGNVYYDKGDYDKAIKCYENSLTNSKNLLKTKNTLETKEDLSIFADAMISHNCLGRAYDQKGNHDKAIEYITQNVNLFVKLPKNHSFIAQTYTILGKIYHHQGNSDKAIEYLTKGTIVKNNPLIAESYNILGDIYCSKDDYDKAIEYYKKCLEILKTSPKNSQNITISCCFNLAKVYKLIGEYSNNKAKKCFTIKTFEKYKGEEYSITTFKTYCNNKAKEYSNQALLTYVNDNNHIKQECNLL
ncbi:MAG: hypothetical protein AMS24_01175 [Chlamydiae bacterium SM23_39]|nr:MAG: hypothetical protein AMS24_01175 [Chlamydiae bacterium SM23_39]